MQDYADECQLSHDDWDVIQLLHDVLKPFMVAQKMLEGGGITGSLIISIVGEIRESLNNSILLLPTMTESVSKTPENEHSLVDALVMSSSEEEILRVNLKVPCEYSQETTVSAAAESLPHEPHNVALVSPMSGFELFKSRKKKNAVPVLLRKPTLAQEIEREYVNFSLWNY
jgi:hypothetical protein